MSHICANNTYANHLATTQVNAAIAVVVCSSPNPSFPANNTNNIKFYGCGPSPEVCELGRVWADCTATSSGEYNFTWSDDVYSNPDCAIPVVTLNGPEPVSLYNLTTISAVFPEVSAFGGNFSGNASMLWAYDGVDVSDSTPTGYFGGDNVTTVPQSCDYLSCMPASNETAAPCSPLSANAETCFGDATACLPMSGGQSLSLSEECDWVEGAKSAYADHPNGSYFFPPGCDVFTVCEHTTVPAIFPDDNTCLCLPGFESSGAGNCTITVVTTGVVCGEEQYAQLTDNATYECVDLTTCSGEPLLEATETSDRVCVSPPEVCVGFVNSVGVCVTPSVQCTSLQFIRGSTADGAPDCGTLSPPCPSHSFEKTPPTPTSDRICVRYTGVNVYAATGFAVAPCAIYFGVMAYLSLKR